MSLEIFQDAMREFAQVILTLRNPNARLEEELRGVEVSVASRELAGRVTVSQGMELLEAALKAMVMHHSQEIEALRQEVASVKNESRVLSQRAERILQLVENRNDP